MNIKEWDNHWTKSWKQYLRQRDLKRLRAVLKPLLKGKIADIGCGVTNMYGPEHDITGVDISPEGMEIMKKLCPSGTWIAGDAANTGLPSSTFDTIVCSHVLEHFFDQTPVIEELKRIAKPDGNIIIAVPRRSFGPDHIHPKWDSTDIQDRIASHLKDAKFELMARCHWVVQGKKTATATVVMIAWSPTPHRMAMMKNAVKTLRTRTKYPYKWVFVDNGPAEQTEFIEAHKPDIHIYNQVNQRPPVSRNMGAGCANTDYIAFVDNDVEFYEDWLADSIAMLEKYPDRKLIATPSNCQVLRRKKNGELDGYCLSTFGASTCWVMRRKTFEEVGRWNEVDTVEDYDYAIRAGMKGYSFIYRDEGPLVKHNGLHKRTFQVFERFVDGKWLPDPTDKRGWEVIKRNILKEYAQKFGTKIFVETGTYKGDTVKSMLLSKLFTKIYSVDIDGTRTKLAQRRFRSFPYIHCDCGDSRVWLPEILKQINEPALFWLDAHASYEQVKKSGIKTPILDEVGAIVNHGQDHVVLIDDARYYEGGLPDYPSLEQIKSILPDWKFEVKEDIIRAYRNEKTR